MQTVKHIHNTGFMPQSEVESLKKSAVSQEHRILAFLNKSMWFETLQGGVRHGKVTASEIWLAVRKSEREPLTSIRRALDTLKGQEKVEQLEETAIGYYGKSEHLWSVK